MTIINEGIKFSLDLPSPSPSGTRQPLEVEIRCYCMVLKQTDKEGVKHEILISESQFWELRSKLCQINRSTNQIDEDNSHADFWGD